MAVRILALEPYYGGSHRAFLDGWKSHSRHEWTILELPAHKWKWRMRHSAIHFAGLLKKNEYCGRRWDLVFCSDMLNLAEFLGLAPEPVVRIPRVAYFHENQLTYPVRLESERDYQFAVTNLTTALAADRVWFNTAYHRDSFLTGLSGFFKKMPDHRPFWTVEAVRSRSEIQPPGIEALNPPKSRRAGPMRVLWAARWEHDKNPEAFFGAVKRLEEAGIDFRLNVIGETFREVPPIFGRARDRFRSRIDHWGFQPTRTQYENVLADSDVVVSTADHEFFGISVLEAVAAGAFPLLPPRLSYPEIFGAPQSGNSGRFFYDGTERGLAEKLVGISRKLEEGSTWEEGMAAVRRKVSSYFWTQRAPEMDRALERLAGKGGG